MKHCDSTIKADDNCDAWTRGWPWHGCAMPSGHNQTGGRGNRTTHECKCGEQWSTSMRLV